MTKKLFYINKRFLERYPKIYDTQCSSINSHEFGEINGLIQDCESDIGYLEFHFYIDDFFEEFIEYLNSNKESLKNKKLILLIHNYKNFDRMTRINSYFKEVFYFFELCASIKMVLELGQIDREHMSLLPVASYINKDICVRPDPDALPNNKIFFSLGHCSDNTIFLREIIKSNPDITFYSPDISYSAGTYQNQKIQKKIDIDLPNLKLIKAYSKEYKPAFNECDTVIIPISTTMECKSAMVGGLRLSNAMRSQKYIIMPDNPINRIVMAKDGKTCCLTDGSIRETNSCIKNIMKGNFKFDKKELKKIRGFMDYKKRLDYMYDYVCRYDLEKRLSDKKNFKFDKEYLNFLEKQIETEQTCGKKIDSIYGIKIGTKIGGWIIYKIVSFDDGKASHAELHLLENKTLNKSIVKISKEKEGSPFITTKNGYNLYLVGKNYASSSQKEMIFSLGNMIKIIDI